MLGTYVTIVAIEQRCPSGLVAIRPDPFGSKRVGFVVERPDGGLRGALDGHDAAGRLQGAGAGRDPGAPRRDAGADGGVRGLPQRPRPLRSGNPVSNENDPWAKDTYQARAEVQRKPAPGAAPAAKAREARMPPATKAQILKT